MICKHFDPITTACVPCCCVCSYYRSCEKESAAADAANIDDGMAEAVTPHSASQFT